MRVTCVLASRHSEIYETDLVEHAEFSRKPIERIAFVMFLFFVGLLFFQRVYSTLEMGDFAAFYCGGAAVRAHIDPYQIASLHACENRVVGVFHHNLFPGQTIPAPFPPFALAIFALFSFVSPAPACYLWLALTASCYAVVVLTIRRMCTMKLPAIVAASAIPLMLIAFPMGQLTLPIFALLVSAAHAWRRGYVLRAVIPALGTLISPTLGGPICLTLALCDRAARMPLLIGGLLIALLNFTIMPWEATRYYLFTLLPKHAQSELYHDHQYSLSHALAVLHVPSRIALVCGSVDYVLMVVIGIFLATLLAWCPRQRDLALFVPPTAAVFGGSYIHIWEIAVASFTAMLVYREVVVLDPVAHNGRKRILACMTALALPLGHLGAQENVALYLSTIALFSVSAFQAPLRKIGLFLASMYCMLIVALLLLALRSSYVVGDDRLSRVLQHAVQTGGGLEDVWRLYIDNHSSWQGWVSVLLQVPIACSLSFLLLTITALATSMAHRRSARLPRS